VEELLLGLRLAREELDIVDQEHVRVAVGLLEGFEGARTERPDEVVGERLDSCVTDLGGAAERGYVVADRVEEVGLSEPGRRVQEERVVGLPGEFGDRERRCMSEAVAVANDELVEAIPRVEAAERLGHPPCLRSVPGRALDRNLNL
jgi:hypothetical protein